LRKEHSLELIEGNMNGFQSPILGIIFEIEKEELQIYRSDGLPFLDYEEQSQLFIKERKQRMAIEREKEQVELEKQQVEFEKQQAVLEKQQVEFEKQQAVLEKQQVIKEKEEEMLAKEEALAQLANLQEILKKAGISIE
jgi:hypothetical protein